MQAEARLGELASAEAASLKPVVDREFVQGLIRTFVESPVWLERQAGGGIMEGSAKQWQSMIRELVGTVWLEPDGIVTVEGLLTTAGVNPSMKTVGKCH